MVKITFFQANLVSSDAVLRFSQIVSLLIFFGSIIRLGVYQVLSVHLDYLLQKKFVKVLVNIPIVLIPTNINKTAIHFPKRETGTISP